MAFYFSTKKTWKDMKTGRTFATKILEKGFVSKLYKILLRLDDKINNPTRINGQDIWSYISPVKVYDGK